MSARGEISEGDVVMPTLRQLARSPNRWVPIHELTDELIGIMSPTDENKMIFSDRISLLLRNMVFQKTGEENIIRAGYAVFMDNKLKITEDGLAFLKRKIG